MVTVRETGEAIKPVEVKKYGCGFETLIAQAPNALSEETAEFIAQKKNEPGSMLQSRLEAYRRELTMKEPTWGSVDCPRFDFQDLYSWGAPKPKRKKTVTSLDEVLETYEKLGISLREIAMLRRASSRSLTKKIPCAERSRTMRSSIRYGLRPPSRRS